jgi:hypothetical protein
LPQAGLVRAPLALEWLQAYELRRAEGPIHSGLGRSPISVNLRIAKTSE